MLVFVAILGSRGINPILPKGIPDNYSCELRNLVAYEVVDDEKYLSLDTVLRTQAEFWVTNERSRYLGSSGSEDSYVLDPDYHTFGWLKLSELEKCIKAYNQVEKTIPMDIKILIEVLQVLVNYYGMDNVRFVFWFDN